jgi:hypothetical protein
LRPLKNRCFRCAKHRHQNKSAGSHPAPAHHIT